jgi:hypothetical protein
MYCSVTNLLDKCGLGATHRLISLLLGTECTVSLFLKVFILFIIFVRMPCFRLFKTLVFNSFLIYYNNHHTTKFTKLSLLNTNFNRECNCKGIIPLHTIMWTTVTLNQAKSLTFWQLIKFLHGFVFHYSSWYSHRGRSAINSVCTSIQLPSQFVHRSAGGANLCLGTRILGWLTQTS